MYLVAIVREGMKRPVSNLATVEGLGLVYRTAHSSMIFESLLLEILISEDSRGLPESTLVVAASYF